MKRNPKTQSTGKRWHVQILGDIDSTEKNYELSVIYGDDAGGWEMPSWGWPGVNKIILFATGTGSGDLNPHTKESTAYAKNLARIVCSALNKNGIVPP